MKKSIFFLAALLTLSFAACSGNDPEPAASDTAAQSGGSGDPGTLTPTDSGEGWEYYAFRNRLVISMDTIPDVVREDLTPWYQYRNNITEILFSRNVVYIGDYAFRGCKVNDLHLPSALKVIGSYAFADCPNLGTVTIQSTVTKIGEYAFSKSKISYLYFNAQMKTIPTNAFRDCTGLEKINISSGVETIMYNAFRGCTSLTTLYLPSTLKAIYDYAFADCSSLTSLDIRSSSIIYEFAFRNCTSLTTINITNALLSTGNFMGCTALKEATINSSTSKNQYLPDSLFCGCSSLETISGISYVKCVQNYTFYGCSALKSFSFPALTEIRNYAFAYCTGLEDVYLPSTVSSIGVGAFYSCSNLAKIRSANPTPPYLGSSAFTKTDSGRFLYVKDATAKSAYAASTSWSKFFTSSMIKDYLY